MEEKNKGEMQCCGNYRENRLINYTIRFWERAAEMRLREDVMISEQ